MQLTGPHRERSRRPLRLVEHAMQIQRGTQARGNFDQPGAITRRQITLHRALEVQVVEPSARFQHPPIKGDIASGETRIAFRSLTDLAAADLEMDITFVRGTKIGVEA